LNPQGIFLCFLHSFSSCCESEYQEKLIYEDLDTHHIYPEELETFLLSTGNKLSDDDILFIRKIAFSEYLINGKDADSNGQSLNNKSNEYIFSLKQKKLSNTQIKRILGVIKFFQTQNSDEIIQFCFKEYLMSSYNFADSAFAKDVEISEEQLNEFFLFYGNLFSNEQQEFSVAMTKMHFDEKFSVGEFSRLIVHNLMFQPK